ncbi:hypothetical protein HX837_08500 [Marine Group I thaumarchaeote]|uniref:Uncharacterized protein n=1 Tax=Marine Group I thaumarchaeote TaxID=2511932 RepID=A0A7K4MRK9_9ARCH|nr:hypothetical protein [Marine Group I thaumarchaeote]
MNLISVENLVDDAGLSNSDISITTRGSGYVNVMSTAVEANLTGGGTTNTATMNVHVEVTMNLISNTISCNSSNSGFTPSAENPVAFVLGEGVMANTAANPELIAEFLELYQDSHI